MKKVFIEDVAKRFKFATGVQSATVPYSTSTSRSYIEYTAEGNKTNYAVRTNGSLIGMPSDVSAPHGEIIASTAGV